MATNGGESPLQRERATALQHLSDALDRPMIALAFVWLGLLVWDLVRGLGPFLAAAERAIWIAFLLDFLLEFALAPRKTDYLRRNWLVALSLALPALRVFRLAAVLRASRSLRAARGLRLVRLLSSVNRGMGALRASMRRRGLGYVAGLTGVVAICGGAGMYAFEKDVPGGLPSFGVALWWTAMLLTSIGTEYWPKTGEGRVLCLLLSLYGFGVFGYLAATLTAFFVGRDAENDAAELAGAKQVEELRSELRGLREELREALRAPPSVPLPPRTRSATQGPPRTRAKKTDYGGRVGARAAESLA